MNMPYECSQECFLKRYNEFLLTRQVKGKEKSDFTKNRCYQNMKIYGINFNLINFTKTEFINCSFYDCNFDSVVFNSCNFKGDTIFEDCSFTKITVKKCHFAFTLFKCCRFDSVELYASNFGSSIFNKNSFYKIYTVNENGRFIMKVAENHTSDFGSATFINNTFGLNFKMNHIPNVTGLTQICPEEGAFIGFKQAYIRENKSLCLVKLLIPEDAKRSSSNSRKCRCDKAKVLSITSFDEETNYEYAVSTYDNNFIYQVGETVSVDDFDENRWNECSTGIHFFITKQEAINY